MHLQWTDIASIQDVEAIKEQSNAVPCLIFKHSTRCSISALAKHRLESEWKFDKGQMMPFYLDLIAHRPVSQYIADTFEVYHESPQILLIVNGECVYDTSHLDISMDAVEEALATMRVG